MSDTPTLTVRDHSQPCRHKGNSGARMVGDPEWESEWWGCRVCPGGREIVLRKWEPDETRPSAHHGCWKVEVICVPLCAADYGRPRPAPWWLHEKDCPVRIAAEVERGKRKGVR
jgi:hypothetical protein